MNRILYNIKLQTVCLAACSIASFGQAQPPVLLAIDAVNCVSYVTDTADVTKYGTIATATPAQISKTFNSYLNLCDISMVNGKPAKGMVQVQNQNVFLSPSPASGSGTGISDVTGLGKVGWLVLSLVQDNGTTVGDIFAQFGGGGGGTGGPSPGLPTGVNGHAIVFGGNGPYLGIRGQWGTSSFVGLPNASIMEDPAIRRTRGGTLGAFHQVWQLIPSEYPTVVTTADGPAVYHADFSLVTAAKPAAAGETLIVAATGLGPVTGGAIGDMFPANALPVNSPVTVAVNGNEASVINAIGWPGTNGTYRVDFQVPAGTKGPASIKITSAWIPGPAVTIKVQ